MYNDTEKLIWDFLLDRIENEYGVAGLIGNLYAESGLVPNNLQNSYQKKLGFTDEEYTKAVDTRQYTNFVNDSAGYGLAQWTYWSRKRGLLTYAKSKDKSIGDLTMQLEYLMKELSSMFNSVLVTLRTAESVKEASDVVLIKFERPANMSEENKTRRAEICQRFYDTYSAKPTRVSIELPVLKRGAKNETVKTLQRLLLQMKYSLGGYGADGSFGSATERAVKEYQRENNLSADGSVGEETWSRLLNG